MRRGNLSLQGYRNILLSFGLRCSPTILIISLSDFNAQRALRMMLRS